MTIEDKEELRQIIREELNLRFPISVFVGNLTPAGCLHEWFTDYSSTVTTTRCRKCGAISAAAISGFPNYSSAKS